MDMLAIRQFVNLFLKEKSILRALTNDLWQPQPEKHCQARYYYSSSMTSWHTEMTSPIVILEVQ